jgi:putative ABC transport system permease protein
MRDLRYALRTLRRSPGFAAVAILTLAVGIGANTAIFSVANALLLRPLPYPQAERLVLISAQDKASGARGSPLSWPRFEFTRDHSRSYTGVAAFTNEDFNLTGKGDPEQIRAARVSWNFFDVLGVRPAVGRAFRPGEDQPGGDNVALIGASLWTRRFAADPGAVGRTMTLDGKDYTIIGVLPANFRFGFFGAAVDIVAPRVFELNLVTPQQVAGGVMFLNYVARLPVGTAIAMAQA